MSRYSLPKRLSAIYDIVENGALVADIGTDHALLPIALVENGKCDSAIASDIALGPLKIAEKNILSHGLLEKIKTVQSDGLENVSKFNPKNIIIAGMGGETIRDILSTSPYPKCSGALLLLQPMTHCELLREHLITSGFSILDEKVIREQHRFYVIIAARFSQLQEHYFKNSSAVFELGGISADSKKCGLEYLNWQKGIYERTLCQLEKSAPSKEKDRLTAYFSDLISEIDRRISKNT